MVWQSDTLDKLMEELGYRLTGESITVRVDGPIVSEISAQGCQEPAAGS